MPLLQEPTSPASATLFTSNGTSPAPHGTNSQRSTRSLPAFRYRNNHNNNNNGIKGKYHRFHENAYADYANDDTEDYIEVQGMGLLQDREAAQELHKQRHLMTFNSVQLLKKQKVWLEDVSGTNGTIIELENLERKINWFMENKQQKKDNDPLTPSKALFRSMSMLDTTMEKIQQSHFKEMQKSRSEMQELKKIIASLQSRNSALLDATAGLQKERDALKQELQEEKAAAAAAAASAAAEAATKEQSVVATAVAVVSEDDEENVAAAEISVDSGGDVIEPSPSSTPTKGLDPAAVLGDDLGSRWHTLEDSEEATAHVASLEKQVCQLSALVAEKNGAIENLKGEWQHMRLQLSKLEESRLEYKKECETKESALAVASSRIASLESEVLQTHAKCATSEEDYDALKESFITQKEATKQEIMKSQEECGRKIDEIRTECERLLEASNETVNGLKVTIGGLQNELKELRETCTEQDEKIKRIGGLLKRNMTSESESVSFSRSVVDEVFQEVDGFGFSAAGGLSCDKEGEEKDEETAKAIGNAHGHFNVGRKLAERASSQASTIADLQDANEIKDAQLKALHDMVESLLAERGEMADSRQWGHRIQKWKDSRK